MNPTKTGGHFNLISAISVLWKVKTGFLDI